MNLETALYQEQNQQWPSSGQHIMAQFDEEAVVVYQAYKPSIGLFATKNGYFGGDFSFTRMSWIKPNFLWMMYRSGWGTKENQEVTLAIWLKRPFFDHILSQAVPSSFSSALFATHEAWQKDVARSNVRLQWDPDHDPSGAKQVRRAIQLGLRRDILEGFKGEAILAIEDISPFVEEQRRSLKKPEYAGLMTPKEAVYPVADPQTRQRLGLG